LHPNKPFFSIIVPVYNVEKYLGACLDSFLSQTFTDFEVIVVDDVSTDGSRNIARTYQRQYPDKIQLIEHTFNTRQGGARNTGIAAATGDYLMFIDSDDYLKTDALEIFANTIARENADIVECCFSYVDEQGHFLRRSSFRDRIARLGEHIPLLISEMGPCNKVYRAELFRDTGIRFPEKYYYEDYWTVPKVLMAAKRVVYIEDPVYCYLQRSTSTMHDTNIDRNNDIMLGTDSLLQFFSEGNFPEETKTQLESLAIEHVLFHGTLRVNGIDTHSDMQKKLKAYMQSRFPNYRDNPYLRIFPRRQQRLLRYIEKEKYGTVYLLWHCRNRISGEVKKVLNLILRNNA
jgi:glycosyltransferase involved in cell wall biosynthesis